MSQVITPIPPRDYDDPIQMRRFVVSLLGQTDTGVTVDITTLARRVSTLLSAVSVATAQAISGAGTNLDTGNTGNYFVLVDCGTNGPKYAWHIAKTTATGTPAITVIGFSAGASAETMTLSWASSSPASVTVSAGTFTGGTSVIIGI